MTRAGFEILLSDCGYTANCSVGNEHPVTMTCVDLPPVISLRTIHEAGIRTVKQCRSSDSLTAVILTWIIAMPVLAIFCLAHFTFLEDRKRRGSLDRKEDEKPDKICMGATTIRETVRHAELPDPKARSLTLMPSPSYKIRQESHDLLQASKEFHENLPAYSKEDATGKESLLWRAR